MRTVLSFGVFDVLHVGHLNILTSAHALGEKLIVAVQDDAGVEAHKGQPPILTLAERMEQVRALPFVDSVTDYSTGEGRDAIAICREYKPTIVVQGDDWLYSADRTETLAFFKETRTRLILLPRTEHISSTEIKRRISDTARRDDKVLKNLQLLPLDALSLYEEFDEAKVQNLQAKITEDGVFFNPITVAATNDEGHSLRIVVDGANRLEALRRLGVKNVPCLLFDYRQIDLQPNVHYIEPDGTVQRASEFVTGRGERHDFPEVTREDIVRCVREGRMLPSGATWHTPPCSVIRLRMPLAPLVDGSMTADDFIAFTHETAERGSIRYIHRSVYVCDEW